MTNMMAGHEAPVLQGKSSKKVTSNTTGKRLSTKRMRRLTELPTETLNIVAFNKRGLI